MRRMEHYFPVPSQLNGHQVSSLARKSKIQRRTLLPLFTCFQVCSIDDAEVEINDVLGEGDNITFIVRI